MHSSAAPAVARGFRRFGTPVRLCDAAVIVLGAVLAARHAGGARETGFESAALAFALLFELLCFPVFGVYRFARRSLIWRCVCLPVLSWLAVLAASVLAVVLLHRTFQPAPAWVGYWALISACGIVACRLATRGLSLRLAGRRAHTRSVAIVGSGEHCRQLVRKVELAEDSPYRVAAIFDTGEPNAWGAEGNHGTPGTHGTETESARVFRDRGAFAAEAGNGRVDELWLALPLSLESTILEFTALFRNALIDIRFIPDPTGLALIKGTKVDLDGTSAIDLVGLPLTSQARAQKALFDRLFAGAAVVALMPLLVVIGCAVKVSSRGPVLFRQRRKGANGKVFSIYKFRTMHVHREADGVVSQATRGDPRITRVGAFLRRTSLDELPQFFNVLRGEMSVVGPRPHAIEHDALYQNIVDGYIQRYRIKPGITGWAQVNGFRGETDAIEKMRARVEHDLYYLSNWSFGFDMRIILLTIVRGLVHPNAW